MITRNTAQNRFEQQENGFTSVATYEMSPGIMTVTHIIVPQPLRGRGVATSLALEIVKTARQEGFKIVPRCSFMAAYFRRHPEARDVLAD